VTSLGTFVQLVASLSARRAAGWGQPVGTMSSLTERLASFGYAPPQRKRTSGTLEVAAQLLEKRHGPMSTNSVSFRSIDDGVEPTTGGTTGEMPVAVVVRCRPPSSASEATFGFTAEGGHDKVLLRLQADKSVMSRSFRCNKYCGPVSKQQDVFEAASSIVERTMEGYNGTIFCYGVTGSGKTYTMSGPPGDIGSAHRDPDSVGIVQRVSTMIFEYIRDHSSQGEVYSVEASFLEIYSEDGSRDKLIDLLSDEDKHLEVKQDPLNRHGFVCDGLRRVGIRTPDEMCEVLKMGQQRCTFMETSANLHSSRSHCIFILTMECLHEKSATSAPTVQRGKLMLVDLAGSESIKRVQALNDEDEELRRKQAIGINRSLSSLATVVTNMNRGISTGHRDSPLTMLLRDCLGGNSRALLIATIGPELEGLDESVKTLTFAQQMMSVKNFASVNRIQQDQSALVQMRQRQADCIRILEEKTIDAKDEQTEEIRNIKQEMDDLNQRLLTKESAEKTLEDIRVEQLRGIDEMREDVTQAMTKELEKMRKQSLQDLDTLRQSVEKHVTHSEDADQAQQTEEHEARLRKTQAELQDAVRLQRAINDEAADLRVRRAVAEERSKMLQLRQEDLRKERSNFDEERKSLRQQSEQTWQKLTSVEGDTHRYKAEVEVQRVELTRLNAARAEDVEQARLEGVAWRALEAELQGEISEAQRRLEQAKREAELQAIREQSERREACAQLRLQMERLEVEAATQVEQLSSTRRLQSQLLADREEAKQREEALRQQGGFELKQCQDELEETMGREKELMQMLSEIQDGVISASAPPSEC